MDDFAHRVLAWYDQHGRKDLPWQVDRTPYRVWVAEVMLQQTQVTTVIPYYERFMARFPTLTALAQADVEDVLALWSGLGYYARGRNLHAAAQRIANDYDGEPPRELEALQALPGIGRSTAGAILASAFGIHAVILDGNVKRVLARYHAVEGYPGSTTTARLLWQHAESHTPRARVADYTQAVMDLGATLCTRGRPRCGACPLRSTCAAHQRDTVTHYPQPRPRRVMPVKRTRMWLLTDAESRCLLEKRPPSGIWGGLWNPIERAVDESADEVLESLGLLAAGEAEPLAEFRHTFTHFHLDIAPMRVTVREARTGIADGEKLRWYSVRDDEPVAWSRVAVRLLATIEETTA